MRLKDKVAIITGGGGGIGRQACTLFAEEGARLLIAEIDLNGASKIVKELGEKGCKAETTQVDVRNFDAAKQLIKTALDIFGQIDILVNVAGGSAGVFLKTKHSVFAESSPARWREIIDLNLYGTLNCTRAVINHMIERQSGKIVNLSSIAGMIGMQQAAAYSAAKAGVIGFTKALAKEVAPYGIHVNCVSPGVIGTTRIRNMPKKSVDSWLEGIPFGRLGEPDEVARAILFLASSESDFITGENIPVTGGQTLGALGY
jgi:NAD(P)-dependent dehydrogenase (short-subunit alcohol dehydrogenase family)